MKPRFPSFEYSESDDDCIICKKLLRKHSEQDANHCYNVLISNRVSKKGGVNRLWH